MANICNNEFYAHSENQKNLDAILDFFKDDKYAEMEQTSGDEIQGRFDSKWDFPYERMDKLFESIPDKENIFMRCVSDDGCDYVALHKCEENGWYNKV